MDGLASVFPPPPPYFRKYKEEAWREYQVKLQNGEDVSGNELAPPPPPTEADPPMQSYRNYGSIWNVSEKLPGLEESGIEQLYPPGCETSTTTLVPELKRLLYEILTTFLNLLRKLASSPEEFPAKVERLRALFINMHHLLNTYRPAQSKETLIVKIKQQIEVAKTSAKSMRESNARISEQIARLESRLPPSVPNLAAPLTRLAFSEADLDSTVWNDLDLDADLRQADTEGAIE